MLHENGLPPTHTAGGINMNFFPIGPLVRRSGVFFIRRSFKDNAVYKFVLHHYIDYLIEKRFSLLWALEGTRSRTGKLLPPRFGLFNYVLESILRTRLYDVTFIPVSVAYDQITEVEDYSIEQRGQTKKPEGITWPLRFLRRGRSRGQIHLRFGEDTPPLGAVHVDREFACFVEIQHRYPVALQPLGAGDRTGDRAVDLALDVCQQVDEMIGSRTGADTDNRAAFHVFNSRRCGRFFHFVLIHYFSCDHA